MDEIRRRDWGVFIAELFSTRSAFSLICIVLVSWLITSFPFLEIKTPVLIGGGALIGISIFASFRRSVPKRFHFQRFRYIWKETVNRQERLSESLARLKRRNSTDLSDLESNIRRVLPEIYRALRRADLVLQEIQTSEALVGPQPLVQQRVVSDLQAQELYKVADRNVAEYSSFYKQAVSGVERAEAQAIVFSTTLDTLRIRLLNYMLAGRSPEEETREFLNIVAEAKMQFSAIDRALEEIEQMPFPETVTILRGDDALLKTENLEQTPPPFHGTVAEPQLEKPEKAD